MSRQQRGKSGKSSGRQGGEKGRYSGRQGGKFSKASHSRGNSPLKNQPQNKSQQLAANEMRLNKYISNSGVCSRREADIYIQSGNVQVNGEVITEMGYKVNPERDEVKFDGRLIKAEKKEYILLNKPKAFSVAPSDKGKATVYDLVRKATSAKIEAVGRLGRAATGLLLFTNDSDLIKRLNNSKTPLRQIYHVGLNKPLKDQDLKKIAKGIRLEEGVVEVEEVTYTEGGNKKEIGIKIFGNKDGVVKRIFESLGYEIVMLDRVVFGGLTKKDIPRGSWRKLGKQEVINLKML
ncbi:rRNA pseudouridine synthase [Robertkochia marina]|uniref:rRNA pseudouridine synthase n=1 Tax=Robertkochia marina TaxID=1227945 RepID=A0A4S3M3M9_9FLAO|nr:pseudouridine synthase [Robertkochia marina]THD69782.1 rRNA pseudouridine synthase [Robertkochia marina]TRZ46874.1 rRNA pseudouridine synthase [Robertkochia marina]